MTPAYAVPGRHGPSGPSGDRGLQVDRAGVAFGSLRAVDQVSLQVPEGATLAILGPSGCGKSTLLRAVAGLEPLSTGTVRLDGRDLAGVPVHRRGIGLMFQDGQLFDHLSVAGNVAYGPRRQRRPRGQTQAEVARLLELVGLPDYQDRRPSTLSGGERQRVALARALAARPRLLLLDEPLSALDRTLRVRLAADLRRILHGTGTTALLVTHDHEEAFAVADEVALMRAGRLVQQGPPREVWGHPADAEAALFLGYAEVLSGAPLQEVLAAAPAGSPVHAARTLAMRPSALRVSESVDSHAGTGLHARVIGLAPALDELRLLVRLPSGREAHASATLTARVAIGDEVSLRLDPAATAALTG